MQIKNNNCRISFGSIDLTQQEKEKSDLLLGQIHHTKRKDKIKIELLDVFDKHIKKEAEIKSGNIFHGEDFLQKMYLTFFEAIENIKQISTDVLVKILDDFKPENEDLKEGCRINVFSIEKSARTNDDIPIKDVLTEEDSPVYTRAASRIERTKLIRKIDSISQGANLSPTEKTVLHKKSSGKTYKTISEEEHRSVTTLRCKVASSIAKIQDKNNVLPKEFDEFAAELIEKFALTIPKSKIRKSLINSAYLMKTDLDKIVENLSKTIKGLGVSSNSYIKAILKFPPLFSQKPDLIVSNAVNLSKILNISHKDFLKLALKFPQLFYRKPETIELYISQISQLLNIDEKQFIKSTLKHPQLLCQKPETIVENVLGMSKLLNIEPKKMVKAALKQPQLFCLKPETVEENVLRTSRLLKIDAKEFVKASLNHPSIFCLKPETILDNVSQVSKFLGVNQEEYVKISTKHPQLLYQKPKTIITNISKTAKLLNLGIEDIVKLGFKYPQIFCQKPETTAKKVKIVEYYKQIQNKKSGKLVIANVSAKSMYERILNYLVKDFDKLKTFVQKDAFVEYLRKTDKTYEFKIPLSEFTDELIKFAKEFSKKNFGKQIFSFHVIR